MNRVMNGVLLSGLDLNGELLAQTKRLCHMCFRGSRGHRFAPPRLLYGCIRCSIL